MMHSSCGSTDNEDTQPWAEELNSSCGQFIQFQRCGHSGNCYQQTNIDSYNSVTNNYCWCKIQEYRKQQERFTEAQIIQREMSQLEMQREELEEDGRRIENDLRDIEDGKHPTILHTSYM